jgi:D-tagatose-1,6-bisphosphate aldolase subunit GatZ/KbaZ
VEQSRPGPLYVIGTEVPVPGGSAAADEGLAVSEPADVLRTIDLSRQAFAARGLERAWERVIAVVVQPGVEFGDRELHVYEPEKARPLSALADGLDRLVYEAHSSDYQSRAALRALVAGHFAILKVGPALTFAYREVIFALSWLAEALLGEDAESNVPRALEAAMLAQPEQWRRYYGGDALAQQVARRYSFSDRARYYWPERGVQAAVARLLARLGTGPLPLALLSQFTPEQYRRIRSGTLANTAQAIIQDRIDAVLADYAWACGFRDSDAPAPG